MAQYEAKVSLRRTSSYESGGTIPDSVSLETYVLKVLPQDILHVLRQTAKQELAEQVSINNPPSQILVDGKAVADRGIDGAMKRVQIRFADTRMLLSAVRDVWAALVRVTRVQSPPQNSVVARRHFHLYVNGKPAGLLPGALSTINTANINMDTVLRVVGPLVPYGRKLYWNPIGRSAVMNIKQTVSASGRAVFHYGSPLSPRFVPYRLRTIKRVANAQPGDKAQNLRRLLAGNPGYVEGANQIVKRVMRRDKRYAGLHFSDGWVQYPPAGSWGRNSRDAKVPSVSVQVAKKGSVRLKL